MALAPPLDVPGDHHLTGFLRGATSAPPFNMKHTPETGGALWLNDGHGDFTRAQHDGLDHTANCQLVQLADADNDGALDLYVVDSGVDGAGGRNVLFLGHGDGTFVAPAPRPAPGPAPATGAARVRTSSTSTATAGSIYS